MSMVKICGITSLEEVGYINKYIPDFAGFVMFFEKSKRNLTAEQAKSFVGAVDDRIKCVAVMVSPDMEQIKIAESCGFDYVQIHGKVGEELLENSPLPVLRAFNVSDLDNFDCYSRIDNIKGYVFDSQTPGSGKIFDWRLIDKLPRDGKLFLLAGGLNPQNVSEAIRLVKPDGVDVSSGVENDDGIGKSECKIRDFIFNAKATE
ncbi:MAG: phosphoribosylanthranilate isomerase [Ruminococcus sp.]|nr:phosphoribosylanthranilate isomerase [Ruminococcus sp.]